MFMILVSMNYLNEDDRRAYLHQQHAYDLDEFISRQGALRFQVYTYAAHMMALAYVVLHTPLELLFFIAMLWMPIIIAHTVLFRSFFLRWSSPELEDQAREKRKREITKDMLERLSIHDTRTTRMNKYDQIWYYQEHYRVIR